MFSILVFLGVQKSKEEKKKTYNTEYLRKEIHVTLTTSTSCQILSINSHLWALSSAVLVIPPLLFCHAVCSAQWRFHSFLYHFSFTPSWVLYEHSLSWNFLQPTFSFPIFQTERKLLKIWHTKRWDSIKEKKNPSVFLLLKGGLLKGQNVEQFKPRSLHVAPFAYFFICWSALYHC